MSFLFFFTSNVYCEQTFRLDNADPLLSTWQVFDEGTNYTPSVWSSVNGIIDQSSNIYGGSAGNEPEKPGTIAISGNPDWSDFFYKLSLISMDDDSIGAIFRYQDIKNYYRYSMDRQRKFIRLVKIVDGTVSVLAEQNLAYNQNEWYSLKINAIGNHIQILLNDRLMFKVSDNTFLKGKVGLYCWGNSGSSFKDISITPLKTIRAESIPEPETVIPVSATAPSSATAQASSPSVSADSSGLPSDVKTLARQIEILQKEVKALREEAEIRRQLQMTEDEKSEEEEELLTAVGRDYTLLKSGTLGFEYSMTYSYYSLDSISGIYTVNTYSNHNLTNSLFMEYALLDNFTLNTDIPFAFKHYDEDNHSKSINDLGDITFGFQYQPVKTKADKPSIILTSSLSCPTGRSPYEINPEKDLTTGDGIYAISAGMTASKTIDPVIAFGSVGYTYNFTESGLNYKYGATNNTIRKVDPGDYIHASAGFAYALSYKVSLNMSYQLSYGMESTYYFKKDASGVISPKQEIASSVSSIFSIGMGWRISSTQTVITSIAMGFTNDDPDFLISVRMPFEFNLN